MWAFLLLIGILVVFFKLFQKSSEKTDFRYKRGKLNLVKHP